MGARLEERLGLRLRIFLFFALLALAGVALVCVALVFAYRRADAPELFGPFVIAGAVSAFGLLGLTAWIWLLFDENVAKPLTRLAGEIRARAHGPAAGAIDEAEGRYLGDIGPAAAAAAKRLVEAREREEALAAARTAELQAEAARLSGALAALPTPTILTDGEGRVTLYNDAARRALSGHLCLGLGRPVFDCLDQASLAPALRAALEAGEEAECAAVPVGGGETVDVRIRPLAEGGAALALSGGTSGRTSAPAAAPLAARCAAGCGASDFGPAPASPADDAPLARLAYVVFDTETTGLDPERDEVVQIAGLRVVGGRLRPGESFETLVDPGRPIPPTATEVHGVSDEMVAGAP
ncbi:MAG: exonuclease domain-containing protein, partial [Pseudomonadota bacterium]